MTPGSRSGRLESQPPPGDRLLRPLRWNGVLRFTMCLTETFRPDSDLLVGRHPVPCCEFHRCEVQSNIKLAFGNNIQYPEGLFTV